MEKGTRRVFTPEQKFAMVQDIETFPTVKEGLEKYYAIEVLFFFVQLNRFSLQEQDVNLNNINSGKQDIPING